MHDCVLPIGHWLYQSQIILHITGLRLRSLADDVLCQYWGKPRHRRIKKVPKTAKHSEIVYHSSGRRLVCYMNALPFLCISTFILPEITQICAVCM